MTFRSPTVHDELSNFVGQVDILLSERKRVTMSEGPIFGYYIDRTAKSIKGDIKRRFKKLGIDLTPEQWFVLDKLKGTKGVSQVQLGGSTYKDAPTISRIIDLLCKKGYATRTSDPTDRRKFIIAITNEGREVLGRALEPIVTARSAGWQGLSGDDYDALLRILDKINDNLTD